MQYRKKIQLLVFFLLTFVEFGLQTFWLKELTIYSRPIIYSFIAFGYLILGFIFSRMDKKENLLKLNIGIGKVKVIVYIITIVLIGILVIPIWQDYSEIMINYEIMPYQSDIIPSIQTYVQRLLSGETVYKVVHFPGYDLTPDYVSLTWLPYVFAEIFGLDYRIFSLLLFFTFVLIYSFYLIKQNRKNIIAYLIPVVSFLFLYSLIFYSPSIFGRTLELTIAVFYMILAITVMNKNKLVIVLGILLCLLSRYALSFWLVSYLLILLYDRGFKDFIIINFYILVGIITIFIPFISHDLNLFIDGLKYYSRVSINEWKFHGPHEPNDKPYTLSKGFGFAIYFYDYVAGALRGRLQTLQVVHLIVSIVSGLSIYFIYIFNRIKIKDAKIFLIFALKFFLMIFYVFIQIPYDYLYIVPLFLTIPLIGELVNKEKVVINFQSIA
jgi:hypothetical protein